MAAERASKSRPAKGSASAKDLESFRDISDDVIESDFVPYACLFDKDTIATKDGELVQTLKITGLGFDSLREGNLRTAIRTAIRTCIPGDDYAIWLHTLRRRQSLLAHTHFPDSFSGQVDEAWRSQHPSSASFVNELYISIAKAGPDTSLRNRKALVESLNPGRHGRAVGAGMEEAARALTATTTRLREQLQGFGPRLLTMVERDGVFYSEQLEFLEKLINLEARPMPVPMRDLSHVLTSGEITFGFNAMEVRTADNHRRFGAILTLKEYKESTLAGIDKFLEIPCEVIVTQCFDFIGNERAQEAYETPAYYLKASGDKELAQWMELDRLTQGTDGRGFGEQQTTLFLIANTVNQLETNVKMVQRALGKLGMVAIREDLRFEECYWAQLPANFTFVVRKESIDTEHLAGFANLQVAPMGNAAGSPWGAPVSLFTTVQDAPYFFNFHRGESAHTIVLGKPGSGRATFTHFLLAQARKLPLAIWYLDARGRSETFMRAMGGETYTPGTAQCKLNPFHLPETPANREFLALWLSTLIDPHGSNLNRSTLSFFQSLVDQMLQLPREQRRISALLPTMREADSVLGAALQRFCAGGPFAELFDMPEDNFATANLISWNISQWMGDAATRIPLTAYLLHRLTLALGNSPTLIVLDEGFLQLDNPLFSTRATGWLDYLTSRNAAALISTGDVEMSSAIAFAPNLCAKAATVFAMPDRAPDASYAMGFGMQPQDLSTLSYIDPRQHQVLQKRGGESVVLKVNLANLNAGMLATLAGKKPPAAPTLSPADQLAALMGYTKQAV